jgi:hypothetical protein
MSETTPSQRSLKPIIDESGPWLAIVADKVQSLRFGVVQVVVHDSRVVQIERTERIRLDQARATA